MVLGHCFTASLILIGLLLYNEKCTSKAAEGAKKEEIGWCFKVN